jgi:hypothetical protein
MSDRYGSYPPDEPVIGGSYPPPGSPIPAQGEPYIGAPPRFEDEAEAWDDGDDPGEYDDDQYDDDYYDDGYDGEAPARQPMFYVFIGLAALIGGIIIVLLFSLVNGSGGGGDTPASTAFKVFIDSPTPNMRIEIGKPEDVLVRAKASEPITRFELFVGDQPVDALSVTKPSAADDTYSATLRLPGFDKKGNNQIFVRVTAASGEHKDSDKITVIAFEPVGAKPLFIKGKAVADATVREGPGDIFPVVKTLTAGTEVTILGRTRDSDWLLIDMDNGRWVKRNAIGELGDSLSLVPVKDPTPVPQPSATNTAVPSPSPSVSPTPNGKLPDFVPQNATLTDGGAKLRVTIGNPSSNNYTGPLVVSVSGVNPGTLSQAFSVNLPANGSATVEFDLNPPLTTQKTATIKVDPDNAVKEANEDNNRVDFGLTPATSQPDLVITTVDPGANSITIGIRNNGAALPASEITIRITVGGAKAELTKTLALAKGQDASFSVAKPGSGAGRVDVLISGISVASKEITLAP